MLTGIKLGAAIKAAIALKGVKQKDVARAFGVAPPSVTDWIKRGTIDKSRLPMLWHYFQDVAEPEHWGLHSYPIDLRALTPPIKYNVFDSATDAVITLMQSTDDIGRGIIWQAAKQALREYTSARADLKKEQRKSVRQQLNPATSHPNVITVNFSTRTRY